MYNIIFLHLYTLQPNCFPPKIYFPFITTQLIPFIISPSYSLFLFPLWWPLLYSLYLHAFINLVGSFILVLFVCYIPHVSEIIWYLSFSIWLIWKRLFKCHLRRQSEKTANCLPIAYPSKVSWWHVPELICKWIRRIVELFLLTSTPCTLVYHCESGKRWEKVWWAKNSQEKRHS